MAESVKEVVPETRPRGQRRGLDRLRASGEGQASPAAPARTAVRDAAPTAVPQAATSETSEMSGAPEVSVPADDFDARDEVVLEAPTPAGAVGAPVETLDATTLATEETQPGGTAPASTSQQVAGGRPSRVLIAVIALLALLVAFLGYRFWHTHSAAQADKRHYAQLNTVDARNQAVLSAARQASVTLLTYDYRHLDQDFAAVLNGSTGGFKQDFASKQATAKTLFAQGKAIANGQVLDAAVVSSTPSSATALVVIDQTVKNVSVPNGTTKHYRMQLKLNKVGSSWLVSDVEFPA
jgi:Mce-associated membrane protein